MLGNNNVQVSMFTSYQLFITLLTFLPCSLTEYVLDSLFITNKDGGILESTIHRSELFIGFQILTTIIFLVPVAPFLYSLTNVIKVFTSWVVGAFLFHWIAWCFGAPAFESFYNTLHFSTLMATLTVLPYSMLIEINTREAKKIFLLNRVDTGYESTVWYSFWGAVVGSWLGAFPVPLDWDRPWQEWPVSCIMGAVAGYAGGLLISGLMLVFKSSKVNKSKFKFL